MNRLTPHLPESHVVLDLDVGSKKRLFEQIGLIFENSRQVARARVFDSLFDREKLGSTGLGCGVAIPHGRMKNLKEPIAFDAPDDEPVSLLIFLLVPEAATQRHLEILSEIAEMLSDRALREGLKTVPDAAAVHGLVANWQPLKTVA